MRETHPTQSPVLAVPREGTLVVFSIENKLGTLRPVFVLTEVIVEEGSRKQHVKQGGRFEFASLQAALEMKARFHWRWFVPSVRHGQKGAKPGHRFNGNRWTGSLSNRRKDNIKGFVKPQKSAEDEASNPRTGRRTPTTDEDAA